MKALPPSDQTLSTLPSANSPPGFILATLPPPPPPPSLGSALYNCVMALYQARYTTTTTTPSSLRGARPPLPELTPGYPRSLLPPVIPCSSATSRTRLPAPSIRPSALLPALSLVVFENRLGRPRLRRAAAWEASTPPQP